METPSEEWITISYESVSPVSDPGDKPKYIKARKECKLGPGLTTIVRIKTPYDDPFVLATLQTADTGARVVIKDICKGVVTLAIVPQSKASCTVHAMIFEGAPEKVW